MSAPATVEPSRVRARRAPALDPPYDEPRPPVQAKPRPPVQAQPAGQQLVQPGRGPRTQRPITPRQQRGPLGAPPAGGPAGRPAAQATPTGPDAASGPPRIEPRSGPAAPAQPALAPVHGQPAAAAYRPGGSAAPFTPAQVTPAQAAAQRFVGVCVEILNGHRPASHLRAVVAATELHLVADQLVRRTTRAYLGRPGATSTRPPRVRLRALHVGEPRDGVAEVVAVLEYGVTVWAMCARLERRPETWLCTLVQVI